MLNIYISELRKDVIDDYLIIKNAIQNNPDMLKFHSYNFDKRIEELIDLENKKQLDQVSNFCGFVYKGKICIMSSIEELWYRTLDKRSIEILGRYANLKTLITYMNGLTIKKIGFDDFMHLYKMNLITYLKLHIQWIRAQTVNEVEQLPDDIEGLDFSGNKENKDLSKLLERFTKIKRLDVSNNSQGLASFEFKGKDLCYLDINTNYNLRDLKLENCLNLKYINISSTYLNPLYFSSYNSLEEIKWNIDQLIYHKKKCIKSISLLKVDSNLTFDRRGEDASLLYKKLNLINNKNIKDVKGCLKTLVMDPVICPLVKSDKIECLTIGSSFIDIDNIKTCSSLTHLDLSIKDKNFTINEIKNLDLINSLINLISLTLCNVTIKPGFVFRGLNKLENLSISSYKPMVFTRLMFKDLISLNSVCLKNGVLEDYIFRGLKIKELDLSKITNVNFKGLESLETLKLDTDDFPIGLFNPLTNLRYLILKSSTIFNMHENIFLPLKNLTWLEICHPTPLSNFNNKIFSYLYSLENFIYIGSYSNKLRLNNLVNLRDLKLHFTSDTQDTFDKNILFGLVSLESFKMESHSNSIIIREKLFDESSKIKYIYLTNVELFSKNMFNNIPSLFVLSLEKFRYLDD